MKIVIAKYKDQPYKRAVINEENRTIDFGDSSYSLEDTNIEIMPDTLAQFFLEVITVAVIIKADGNMGCFETQRILSAEKADQVIASKGLSKEDVIVLEVDWEKKNIINKIIT